MVLTSDFKLSGVAGTHRDEPDAVRRELKIYWNDHELLSPPLWVRIAWERSNQRSLKRALCDLRPEVVSVWAMGAMSLGLLTALGRAGVPSVLVICDEWPAYAVETDAWMRLFVKRRRLAALAGKVARSPTSLPDLDAIGPSCFVSGSLRDILRRTSPWSFEDSGVVYSGIDRGDFPMSCPVPDRPFGYRLLYVGRIDPRKGIATAIQALALCPKTATLEVIGRGDARHKAELARLAEALGVAERVTFSVAERSQLARSYRRADVLIFPPTWDEPFGLVPLEAMASGTPVVATATGGSAEFLSEGFNCLVFSPGSAEELTAALHRLALSSELRSTLVRGGQETAKALDTARLAGRLIQWHLVAVSGRGTPRPPDVPILQALGRSRP